MLNIQILELLTEGSQTDRENAFKQKGDGFYRCVNRWGEEQQQCILINKQLIEDDEKWLGEQGNVKIDIELACKYERVLEERFYQGLLKIEQWSKQVTQLCSIMRDKNYPEYRHEEEDSQEIRDIKATFRAHKFNEYSGKIGMDIVEAFRKKNCDTSFIEEYKEKANCAGIDVPLEEKQGMTQFLQNNMLYNIRKGGEVATNHINNVEKNVNAVINSYCNTMGIKERIVGSAITDIEKKSIERHARQLACEFVFFQREWDSKTWMELILLKFYKNINDKKPKLEFDKEQGKFETESLNQRRGWIKNECKKWFVERENYDIWQFTEQAVMELVELEDIDERLDLMNYTISPNVSIYPEIEMIILQGDKNKNALEYEAGFYDKLLSKVLNRRDATNMNPYVACLLWKKCNISFSRMFRIEPIPIPNKDQKIMSAYKEVKKPKSLFDSIALGLEEDSNKSEFWYIPKKYRSISRVCMELSGPEKIKMTVEYLNFECLMIEFPYSRAMERISKLNEEKLAEMLELSEFDTKEELLKHCAEMVVRNYCREFFGIPYDVFQRIKRHADVTIRIQPLLFYKPDGNIQVGYESCFMRNQMTRMGGNGYIKIFEKQVWKDREAFEKDWETRKEYIFTILKEKWKEINACKKYNSEYAMQMSDFFKVDYVEPYVFEGKDAEKVIKKFDTEDTILC